MQLSLSNSGNSIVQIIEGRAVTSSRKVAETFNKQHKDVLRAIKNIECSAEFTERNFALSTFQDSTGRALPEYIITRDGFTFLAMGFTGKQAARFKEMYIEKFNQMESALIGKYVENMQTLAAKIESLELAAGISHRYCSIMGFASLQRISIGNSAAISLGKIASATSLRRGIKIEKIFDMRFGNVNTYPVKLLEEVFSDHYGADRIKKSA